MANRLNICMLSLSAAILASCWAPPALREQMPSLTTDVGKVFLPCDNVDGSLIVDSVVVTSNRSWTASVEEGADWLRISSPERLNLEEFSSDFTFLLCADDNKGEDRSAGITFMADGGAICSIQVTQSARIPRLAVLEASDYGDISPDEGTYPLTIISNMPWTASVGDGPAGFLDIDTDSGDGNGLVTVSVSENLDNDNTRSGEVIVSAEGCPDVVVPFFQRKGMPYLRFEDGINSGKAAPGWFDYEISFNANVSWTACIESSDGFDSPALSKDSGTREDASVTVKFPPAVCFGKEASLRVRFTPEGAEPVYFDIRQEPALGLVIVDTLTARVVTADRWPFSTPALADTPTKKTGNSSDPYFNTPHDLVLVSGYKAEMFSAAGLWYTATLGLNCGGAKGSYIASPAVEGRRLSKVHYRCASASPKRLDFSVSGSDLETPVEGGAQVSLSTTLRENTWVLVGTTPGEVYYLVNSNTGNFYMGDVIFYYE